MLMRGRRTPKGRLYHLYGWRLFATQIPDLSRLEAVLSGGEYETKCRHHQYPAIYCIRQQYSIRADLAIGYNATMGYFHIAGYLH